MEERQKGEQITEGVAVDELVAKETVDCLPYMDWEKLEGEEEEVGKK